MPIKLHCDHDNAELVLIKDPRTPEGLLECPKCHCRFRAILVTSDAKCYNKRFPQKKVTEVTKVTKKKSKSSALLTTPFYTSEDGK
jgi:hypothetical protein